MFFPLSSIKKYNLLLCKILNVPLFIFFFKEIVQISSLTHPVAKKPLHRGKLFQSKLIQNAAGKEEISRMGWGEILAMCNEVGHGEGKTPQSVTTDETMGFGRSSQADSPFSLVRC